MQKVTALTRQKRNPERINVFLDETFAFGLAEIAAAHLRIGQVLTAEEIVELKRQDSFESAKQQVFRFISYRPRSVAEVKRNLRKKTYDEAVIAEVLARMQELQLLDDRAFALYWIEQRETFKPRSQMALRQELMQKGVERAIIDDVLGAVDDTAVARKAAEKRTARWQHLPADQFHDKMGGYLQRRGFSYGVIREIIDEILENLSQEQGN